MADWFEWKGEKCTDYGVHVSSQPTITLAAERVSSITIPGRSGAFMQTEGEDIYDAVSYSIMCFAEHMTEAELQRLDAWLSGSSKLVLPTRPNGYYIARNATQLAPSVILRNSEYRSFTISFSCQPFLYIPSADITITKSATSITNPYSLAAKPVIKVTGTGNVTIEIGRYALTYTGLTSDYNNATFDCENMLAYCEKNGRYYNMCSHVTIQYKDELGDSYVDDDEWPMIDPTAEGESITILYTGSGVTSAKMTPNWRTK